MKRRLSFYMSHSWSHGDLADNLAWLLESAIPGVAHRLIMLPPADPVHREENLPRLGRVIAENMEDCSALLIAGGLYDRFGRWIHREIEAAKGNIFAVKPIITILAWVDVPAGPVERDASDAVVPWSPRALAEALGRLL